MLTTHKKKNRFRCDHCGKLIPVAKEDSMTIVDGRVWDRFDDRWHHYCNKSQWDKSFLKAYQGGLFDNPHESFSKIDHGCQRCPACENIATFDNVADEVNDYYFCSSCDAAIHISSIIAVHPEECDGVPEEGL